MASMRLLTLIVTLYTLCVMNSHASLTVEHITDSAFNGYINGVSFQQDAIVTYNGYQYATYWSVNRHVAVARKALNTTQWETLELTDYTFATDNAHYDISLGISPRDGTLHLSFYQWSSRFNYRKSVPDLLQNPSQVQWRASLFNPVQHTLHGPDMGPTTYPRFVTAPSGKLLMLLRHGESGAGDSHLYEYDGDTGRWSPLGKLVDGFATDINAYFNGLHYDPQGRLHATWVWRATPDATTNFNLHYVYSDDDGRTWHNNAGQQVAVTGQTPITQHTPGIAVWQIGQNRGLINQEAQAVDSAGRVSMLMSHLPDHLPNNTNFTESRHKVRVFHYMRDLNGEWTRRMLPGSSFSYDRNKIAADSQNNLYAVINRDGIYRATADAAWEDWHLVQSLTDQGVFAEVQLDRQQLAEHDTLSLVHITNKGRMLHFQYRDEGGATPISDVGGGPEGYIHCATEGETCQFDGPRDVVFGVAGQFVHRLASGSIACHKDHFGEPLRGSVKRCYYSAQPTDSNTLPHGYSLCADEDQVCEVSALSQVAFGANGAFHYRLVDNSLPCTTQEFGDPVRGTVKQCFVRQYEHATAPVDSSSSSSSSSATSNSSSSINHSSGSSSSSTDSEAGAGSLPPLFALCLGLLFVGQRAILVNRQ